VLLEAGTDSGGTDAYPAAFVDPLVAATTVCTYDRPGTRTSDPPPHRRRTLRDLCAVQDQVVAKLPLRTPYVLVGQSGVAATSTSAARPGTPERVAGLVTIDSYHDDPEVLRAEGFVWTDNPEFVDYVDYSAVTAVNRCRQPRLAERECCAGRADAFPACAGAVAECRFALLLQCSRGWRAAGAEVV
jgi:pimeloyl-ACP methyl ester carboxylesterase